MTSTLLEPRDPEPRLNRTAANVDPRAQIGILVKPSYVEQAASPKRPESLPLPMQYLGSKSRISEWIASEIQESLPGSDTFIDAMAGTGAVAHQASKMGMSLALNDLQPYAAVVLEATFKTGRAGINHILDRIDRVTPNPISKHEYDALNREREFFSAFEKGQVDWEAYASFCSETPEDTRPHSSEHTLFFSYYRNTYFGVRQCLEIDAIRKIAFELDSSNATLLLGAAISSMSALSSSTSHLAQHLKPTTQARAEALLIRRSRSILEETAKRLAALAHYPSCPDTLVDNRDFRQFLEGLTADQLANSVIYADPPYFKEHYSRYYHVLDTFVLYDHPELSYNPRMGKVSAGRYRKDRIVSDFGLKSRAPLAFSELFAFAAKASTPVALSYADTSILSWEDIALIAKREGMQVELHTRRLRHSSQGQRNARGQVTEYLFICEPK